MTRVRSPNASTGRSRASMMVTINRRTNDDDSDRKRQANAPIVRSNRGPSPCDSLGVSSSFGLSVALISSSRRVRVMRRRFFDQFLRPAILEYKARRQFITKVFHVTIHWIAIVLDLAAFDSFDYLLHALLYSPPGRKTQSIL